VLICTAVMSVSMNAAIISFNNGNASGVFSTGFSASNIALTGGAVDPHYTLIKLPNGCVGSPGFQCQESGSGTNPTPDAFGPSSYVVFGGAGTPPGFGIYPMQPGVWNIANDAANGGSGSSWIGPRASQVNPLVGGTYSNGDGVNIFASNADFYAYRMVFNLTVLGLNPATANITLGWLSDNNTAGGLNSHIRLCSIASASDPVCAAGVVPSSGNSGESANTLNVVNITSGFTSGLMALDFIVYNAVVGDGLNPSGLRVDIISATADDGNVPEPATVVLIGAGLAVMCFVRRRS
jgi:hypothetical protein